MAVIKDLVFSFDKDLLKLKIFSEEINCDHQAKFVSRQYILWSKTSMWVCKPFRSEAEKANCKDK